MEVTGVVSQLNGVGLGVMASVHGEVTARAQRRQRARSVPCGSRREPQRVRGSGRPRGELRWFGALGGVVGAVSPAGVRKAAAGVGHGAAHLLLLVADARKVPGVRAVQEQEGGDDGQGDAVVLARSTSFSEENDSRPLQCSLNFLNLT